MTTNNATNTGDPIGVTDGGTGATTVTGVLTGNGTSAITASPVSQHGVIVGGASNAVASVAPSATVGVPLISQGAGVDPVFGAARVEGGGTGATTLTGIVSGNGTSPMTASAVTQYAVLLGGASNAVAETTVGLAGQVLQSSGAGVNPAYSTATYPLTTTANQLLYSSATNTISEISTLANGVLVTDNSSVPSLLANSGTAGFVLTANTGAPPSWQVPAGGSAVIQTFTSSGTYTPTASTRYCIIECVGGGGAAGGSPATGVGQNAAGGSGGGGGYARGVILSPTSFAVTVGAGGTGVSGSTGNTGGTTTASTVSATGGVGGAVSGPSATVIASGGAGGGLSTGDFGCDGSAGDYAFVISGTLSAGGNGGSSFFGGGVLSGTAGANYGGGAGSNFNGASAGAKTGASGGDGLIVITDYV